MTKERRKEALEDLDDLKSLVNALKGDIHPGDSEMFQILLKNLEEILNE